MDLTLMVIVFQLIGRMDIILLTVNVLPKTFMKQVDVSLLKVAIIMCQME